MKPTRSISDINTGNSAKRWKAIWKDNGTYVCNEHGQFTIFTCGSYEATQIEHRYGIYLLPIRDHNRRK